VQVATTFEEVLQLAREHPLALAVVHPDAANDGWALCRQIQRCIGAPVIGLLPPDAPHEPAADLHVLPVPVDASALRLRIKQLLAMVPS
jgi:hypothetical protein